MYLFIGTILRNNCVCVCVKGGGVDKICLEIINKQKKKSNQVFFLV